MFAQIKTLFYRRVESDARDKGQTMAEYGLILELVAVLCVAAFTALQGGIAGTRAGVVAALSKAPRGRSTNR